MLLAGASQEALAAPAPMEVEGGESTAAAPSAPQQRLTLTTSQSRSSLRRRIAVDEWVLRGALPPALLQVVTPLAILLLRIRHARAGKGEVLDGGRRRCGFLPLTDTMSVGNVVPLRTQAYADEEIRMAAQDAATRDAAAARSVAIQCT